MAFDVRIFGYQGLARLPIIVDGGGNGEDSVYVPEEPYVWTQKLTCDGATVVETTENTAPSHLSQDPTTFIVVEVPDGQAIRYEINFNTSRTASTSSPKLTGTTLRKFGPSYTISMVDAASV